VSTLATLDSPLPDVCDLFLPQNPISSAGQGRNSCDGL
jgi:hypothetical protein